MAGKEEELPAVGIQYREVGSYTVGGKDLGGFFRVVGVKKYGVFSPSSKDKCDDVLICAAETSDQCLKCAAAGRAKRIGCKAPIKA